MGTKEVRKRLLANKPKPATKVPTPQFNSMYLRGPGSAIQYISIHRYHASSCNGCHATAREMDRVGPEACLRRIEEFAQKMHENAQLKKWNKLLDFVAYNLYGLGKYKELIREGVNKHLAEVARKRSTQ